MFVLKRLQVGGADSPNTTEFLPIDGGENTQGISFRYLLNYHAHGQDRIGQGVLQNSVLISGTGTWRQFGARKANAVLNSGGGTKTDRREEHPPVTSLYCPFSPFRVVV